jgi:hypothetical protein
VQAVAHLDHLLLILLLLHLSEPQMSKRRAKNTLDAFGKRRRMAHALGLIDDATSGDLRTINAVRIVFAHAEVPVRFGSAPIREKAEDFRDWRRRASVRRLFDQAVARAEAAMQAKIDEMIFADATKPGRAARLEGPRREARWPW